MHIYYMFLLLHKRNKKEGYLQITLGENPFFVLESYGSISLFHGGNFNIYGGSNKLDNYNRMRLNIKISSTKWSKIISESVSIIYILIKNINFGQETNINLIMGCYVAYNFSNK